MEEMNRKLAEQLEKTNRAHDEQMKQLLERFGELSNRLNDGEKDAGNDRRTTPPRTAPPER